MTIPPGHINGQPGGQPPGPPQPQFLTGADLNMRIKHGDPAFSQELWGRTVGEAMRYYAVMRQDFMNRNSPANRQPELAGQPATGSPPAAPSYQPPPTPRGYQPPTSAPAAPAAPQAFDEDRIASIVQQTIRRELGNSPIAFAAADAVKQQISRKYSDFAQFEQQIVEELKGADAQTLADFNTWETAYFYVKGRAMATGQPATQPQEPSMRGPVYGSRGELVAPPPAYPGYQPPQSQPPQPPSPPANPPQWFSESPSAPPTPGGNGYGAADPRLDPVHIRQAARHNIPIDEYVQWLNGNVPPMQQGGR